MTGFRNLKSRANEGTSSASAEFQTWGDGAPTCQFLFTENLLPRSQYVLGASGVIVYASATIENWSPPAFPAFIDASHPQEDRASVRPDISDEVQRLKYEKSQELIRGISQHHGLAWIDLSRLLGVSVPAIRKWRTVGQPSDENHEALATLYALLNTLELRGVRDPSRWLSLPLVAGYSVSPKDIYGKVQPEELLELTSTASRPESLLDRVLTDWRTVYSSDFHVIDGDDGDRIIVRKSE